MRGLRAARKRAGLTPAELAVKAGVSVSTIDRIELGLHSPRLVTAEAIAKALGVPLGRLVNPPKARARA